VLQSKTWEEAPCDQVDMDRHDILFCHDWQFSLVWSYGLLCTIISYHLVCMLVFLLPFIDIDCMGLFSSFNETVGYLLIIYSIEAVYHHELYIWFVLLHQSNWHAILNNGQISCAGMEMARLICGGCQTLLMYTRNAITVRCSCCDTVNLVRPGTDVCVGLSCRSLSI